MDTNEIMNEGQDISDNASDKSLHEETDQGRHKDNYIPQVTADNAASNTRRRIVAKISVYSVVLM